MRTRVATIIGLLAVLALAVPIAGCGDENDEAETPAVVEGEPLELGGLIYNVSITRFLNPNITEDMAYLEGSEEEPQGMSYLGVFLQIKNEGEEEIPSAANYSVLDGAHRVFEPVELETEFTLETGASVPPDGIIPKSDTVAASGPTQGALILFLVDDDVSEERPLELEIKSAVGGTGIIELDI
jgi:hypothetical protein